MRERCPPNLVAINGLSSLVKQSMRLNPVVSALFAFGKRCRDRVKIIDWDGNSFRLLLKQLEVDRFIWPNDGRQCR
ncbi:IS66 family insertion sequence element accessory protein TnpB [Burkholderia sp. PU8-34]